MNGRPAGARGRPHPLAVELARLMRERGLHLAVAESCTGGLVGHLITGVAGSSEYFLGGVVAYANSAKEALLGVQRRTLAVHGAVSPETAREMAAGARRAFGAQIGAAVTGIAGPGGGAAGKPVGLTFIHLSGPDAELAERHVFGSDRAGNRLLSAEALLGLIVRHLRG